MNGLAACLEYGTLSWMCISDGHNGIWTYWAFLQIPTWPKPKTKNFLLWINANRLCLHVGLEFWTIFSFTCSESTSFTTCKIRFYTLYITTRKYPLHKYCTGWWSKIVRWQDFIVLSIWMKIWLKIQALHVNTTYLHWFKAKKCLLSAQACENLQKGSGSQNSLVPI